MKKELLKSIRKKTSDINTDRSYSCRVKEAKKLYWRKFGIKVEIRINCEEHLHTPYMDRGFIVRQVRDMVADLGEKHDFEYKTRYEWHSLHVFFAGEKDLQLFLDELTLWNEVKSTLTSKPVYVTDVHIFPVAVEDVGDKKNVVVCNKLPFGKYRYRVYVDHKNIDNIPEFMDYFERQCKDGKKPFKFPQEWYRATGRTRNSYGYGGNGFYYGSRPYLYVEDEKQMSILGFYAAQVVKRIDEYRTKNELAISE